MRHIHIDSEQVHKCSTVKARRIMTPHLWQKEGQPSEYSKSSLHDILRKAENEEQLCISDILFLLNIDDEYMLQDLYQVANSLRKRYFGNDIYLYGFLYLSTYCKNNCTFCYFRRDNTLCQRYRKTNEEIVQAAHALMSSGVHLLDLTMGEDPRFHTFEHGFATIIDLLHTLHSETSLPLMLSPGVLSYEKLKEIQSAGVSWYACYQETYSTELFAFLRCGQSFDARLTAKKDAKRLGLLTEEGILCGVGESWMDLASSLLEMSGPGFDQLRAMTFIPQAGTPMQDYHSEVMEKELKLIAILRLLNPSKCIPASLDVEGLKGLCPRLKAGANVITSIVPPGCGLAGVANHALDIDNFNRTVDRIRVDVESLGLDIGSLDGYRAWMDSASALTAHKACTE